ncbi:ribonucleotide-diphosphate reductase subunit beta [Actinomycetospora endophytica]|uniref:Ribonucleotide-diphosphate reductase subunit beta n=1 Tax=Actinomycetospora endophytica TaxID=2291215 RepID=A0ABS8P9H7_9PSEU|nr:ribonucleotide-diphosphate reductase subunit beta [Actinomycetospora endophytica]MCD2194927.1 ribonucleotide-diphosphate reductase subunit beta [Actinomycetospora endophytica]
MITGYGHFVQLADSLQWDETAIDLTADIEAWGKLEDQEYDQILGLLAGFCVGETSVAVHLTSFEAKATIDDSMAACFRSQARDEARHARFFDRVVSEVAGIPGANMTERLEVLRERVSPELLELFEERLPALAYALADDQEELTSAVGLYHMILEGVVLTAGQHALLKALSQLSVKMPGVHKGMELVLRDERWHIGFGSRVIQSADIVDDEMEELLNRGTEASKAWGNLISSDDIDKVKQLHQRRLKAVGIKFW